MLQRQPSNVVTLLEGQISETFTKWCSLRSLWSLDGNNQMFNNFVSSFWVKKSWFSLCAGVKLDTFDRADLPWFVAESHMGPWIILFWLTLTLKVGNHSFSWKEIHPKSQKSQTRPTPFQHALYIERSSKQCQGFWKGDLFDLFALDLVASSERIFCVLSCTGSFWLFQFSFPWRVEGVDHPKGPSHWICAKLIPLKEKFKELRYSHKGEKAEGSSSSCQDCTIPSRTGTTDNQPEGTHWSILSPPSRLTCLL